MTTGQLNRVVQHLRALARRRGPEAASDGELLGRFVRHRQEAAFAELVRRHGPMVLGVCRRVLSHAQDAEDAFQATFLVLVRRAGDVRPAERVGNWLYGVAYRTALEARSAVARRRAKEAKVTPLPQVPADEWAELRPLLDQELARLPDKYRVPILLCDLQGKTRKEAARQMGVPEGTVASRLARGRDLLARRLTRRGLPVTAAAAALGPDAAAAVPEALSAATIRAATLVAAGQAAVPARVAALVEGVTKVMLLSKLKVASALVVGLALTVAGLGAFAQQPAATPGEPAGRAAPERPKAAAAEKKPAAAEDEPITAIWITDKRVQQELRLTEAQVKKLAEVRVGVYRKFEAELKEAQAEAKKHNYARYQEVSRKVQAAERAALTEAAPKILSAGALKRVRQIQRQAGGLHNLVQRPAVQRKLNLTDEQVQQIEGFLKEGLEASRKEARKRQTGPVLAPMLIEDYVVMEQRAYAPAMKQVVGVFTEEQRRAWNDLVGEPFAFKSSAAK